MTILKTMEEAEDYVNRYANVYWEDGWNIICWHKTPSGAFSSYGKRMNGVWGIVRWRVFPSDQGWVIKSD